MNDEVAAGFLRYTLHRRQASAARNIAGKGSECFRHNNILVSFSPKTGCDFSLKGCCEPNKLQNVTAMAERILSEFDSLDPREKLLVRAHVVAVTQSEQRKAIERLRGSGKGEHLLGRLLNDRAEERARG